MPVIIEGDFQHYQVFIAPVALLIITAAVFSLAALLVKNKILLICSMAIAGFMPYVLSIPSDGIGWGVIVVTVLLLPYAALLIRKEAASSLQHQTARFLKHRLKFYFTAMALVFSLFYLHTIDEQKVFSVLFPRPLFDFVLRSFSGTLQGATGLPAIQPEQTVDEVLMEIVRSQFQSQGISVEKISRQELNDMVSAQREAFAKAYHISIRSFDTIGAVFANAVTSKIKDMVGEYDSYLPFAAAVAFFFAVKTFSIILYFFSVGLAVLLMKFLVLVKVVKKEIEQIEAVRLVL
jgi:hypothetical protein